MRRLLLLLCLCLWTAVWAGNRADVNADRAVNAADLAVLGNLVAGNLDLGNYDLANVVVVAPQGGDFSSPRDAVDWVAGQSPSSTERFVVLVTPGVYHYSGQFYLPSYTTLCGYGPGNTRLVQDSNYAGVNIPDRSDSSIANLTIEASDIGVFTQTSTNVRLDHVVMEVLGSGTKNIYGILCNSSIMEVVDCEVRVGQNLVGYPAYALYLAYTSGMANPNVRVRTTMLSGDAKTSSLGYYHAKTDPDHGWAFLFHCILIGETNTATQLVRFGCCDPSGNPVP
jgi:hypothetical protein